MRPLIIAAWLASTAAGCARSGCGAPLLPTGGRDAPREARTTPNRAAGAARRNDGADTSDLIATLESERRRRGGYDAWASRVAPQHWAIQSWLAGSPRQQPALVGQGGFLFLRRSLRYVVGGDVQTQPDRTKNPFGHIVAFQRWLARAGVDFLLVPVPTKVEVYPDRLAASAASTRGLEPINPYGRKLLLELARAGVESLDLLPRFLAARRASPAAEPLYQPQDSHWADRGIRLTAALIGQRVRRYSWHAALANRRVRYTVRPTRFARFGDLYHRLPPAERGRYAPDELVGHQVLRPDGELYRDQPGGPVVILGDSYAGVYQRVDCGHAGISAHVAREIGHPVDLEMSWGGGPNIRRELAERGMAALGHVRLVIWLLAARDFFDYPQGWQRLGEP